jgi:Ca2+-binding RTX toxin-like protein
MTSVQALAADGDATFNSTFTGFETLRVSAALAAGTLDVDGINDVTRIELALGTAAATTITNLNSGGTIELEAAATGGLTVGVQSAVVSVTDVLNIELNNAAGTDFVSVAAANVETINITSDDESLLGALSVVHTLSLAGSTGLTTVTVSGNNGLTLTGVNTITSFDASGVVANAPATGGVADTGAGLAVTYVSTTAAGTVTITGGEGDDDLTGAGANDFISGGLGNDTLDGGAGDDILLGGDGDDDITGGVGVDLLTGGAGIDTFNFATGASGQTVATADTITDFTTGEDILHVTDGVDTLGTVTVADGSTLADFAAFVAAANATFTGAGAAGTNDVYVAWNAIGSGNAYVAIDEDNSGTFDAADSFVILTGVNVATEILAADFL